MLDSYCTTGRWKKLGWWEQWEWTKAVKLCPVKPTTITASRLYGAAYKVKLQFTSISVQNVITSSFYPIRHLFTFTRMGRTWGHSDLWPPKSNQLIFHSKCTFVPNVKKSAQGVPEISLSQEWDGHEVTVTFDHQNLISSCLSPSGRFSQILRNLIRAFPRYHENGTDVRSQWPDLWLPKFNQFMLESRWTFMPNLKKLPPSIPEISRSREWHGRTAQKHNVSGTDNPKSIMSLATAVVG